MSEKKEEKKGTDGKSIIDRAAENLKKVRAHIKHNLANLAKAEGAIEELVREQVDLPTDIQITALVSIPARTVITVDKNELDTVLMGMAKGQIVAKGDNTFVLVIKERVKSPPPKKE